MSSKFDSYQKRRLRSSYFSVVVSIALVLFMVGVLGLILLKSTKVANRVKEKIAITLFIKDNVTQKQIKSFKEFIEKEEYSRKVIYTKYSFSIDLQKVDYTNVDLKPYELH